MSIHTIAEARLAFSTLIDRALSGEDVVITRDGEPVLELKAIDQEAALIEMARPIGAEIIERIRRHRVGPKIPGLNAGELLRQMRDEDDARLFRR